MTDDETIEASAANEANDTGSEASPQPSVMTATAIEPEPEDLLGVHVRHSRLVSGSQRRGSDELDRFFCGLKGVVDREHHIVDANFLDRGDQRRVGEHAGGGDRDVGPEVLRGQLFQRVLEIEDLEAGILTVEPSVASFSSRTIPPGQPLAPPGRSGPNTSQRRQSRVPLTEVATDTRITTSFSVVTRIRTVCRYGARLAYRVVGGHHLIPVIESAAGGEVVGHVFSAGPAHVLSTRCWISSD